ncbi:MAG: T9SS type A sorting domain-containing protein, partial [Bacteroidales bacterium]|nr:T9SS type A sorting domain-containing protein [Bacteroidales bacterium]
YNVIFDGNGSNSGSMSNQAIVQGASANLTTNAYTRTGYVFASWNTNADGTGTTYADGANFTMGTSDVTLYAQWDVYVPPCIDESFESSTFPPAGWTNSTNGAIRTTNNPRTGSASMAFNGVDDAIYTPKIDFPEQLSFWYRRSSNTTAWKLNIQVSTDASNWTDIGTISSATTTYQEFTYDLSSYTDIYIRLLDQRSTGGHERYVDDFEVYCKPSHNIIFEANGGTGSMPNQAVIDNTTTTINLNTFIRDNHNFTSWNTEEDGSGTSYADGASFDMGTEDVTLYAQWEAFCVPTHSIISFTPTSGPSETMVTIKGTGFTGATAVKFGTSDALSFNVLNDTIIVAEVPYSLNAASIIYVFDAYDCKNGSANNFNFISKTGMCNSSNVTIDGITESNGGLIFYEFFDNKGGASGLISILNASYSPIDLSEYRVERDSEDNWHFPSGTLQTGEIYVINVDNSSCAHLYTLTGSKHTGFNDDDDFRLVKISTSQIVDRVTTPNQIGYYYLRTNFEPNPTHNESSWTNTFLESNTCPPTVLGVSPAVETPLFTITAHPTDITACNTITLSVTSSDPNVSYKWKFNNPSNMTDWLDVNASNISHGIINGENSATLTITGGDLGLLLDYQFYCEISKESCIIVSNAAQIKVETKPYYRSVTLVDGDWSDYTNWEMSSDNITYEPACTFPRDFNSEEVIIQSGTRIVNDLEGTDNHIGIKKLTIEENASLELKASAKLTINGTNAGPDLIVEGTLYDKTNNANSLKFTNSATWILASTGTIIKSDGGSSVVYRDKYEGGMSNIPDDAQWIYRYNGVGNPNVGTINFFYPNLSFENTTATAYAWGGNNNNSFSGSTGGFATVKGDFNIGTTGAACIVSNCNYNVQPMLIYGDLNIGTGSVLKNSNTANTDHGTGFELKGDLNVDGTLSILGGETERVLKFSGNNDQTISGTGTIEAYIIETDKSGGSLLLDRDFQVQNVLKMTNGIIKTEDYLLELGVNTTQKGELAYTSGYVLGKMKRWFSDTLSDLKHSAFPLGVDNGGYKNRFAKIEFTTAPTTAGSLIAEFIEQDMGYNGLPISIIDAGGFEYKITNAENQGYWEITANNLTGGEYTARFTGEGFIDIIDLTKLTLLKRENASEPWTVLGIHIQPEGTAAVPTVARSGLTGFSQFGFGGAKENELPIELLDFFAQCSQNGAKIQWITSSEINNNYFLLQKSTDLKNWQDVVKIDGKGNSNQIIEYSHFDPKWKEDELYRLTQIDFDGQSESFGPITIKCNEHHFDNEIAVYPNPFNDDFTIDFKNSDEEDFIIEIADVNGKIWHKQIVNSSKLVKINTEKLPKGVYILKITNNFNLINRKLIKH